LPQHPIPTAPGVARLTAALALLACGGFAGAGLAEPGAPIAAEVPAQPLREAGAEALGGGAAAAIPPGGIIAFVPQASGVSGDALRRWLAERGWAICDGSHGTPDLRDRMLIGTTDPLAVGRRLGSRDHDHRVRGETGTPVLRNRHTPTGRAELRHLPDDQHRHSVDLASDRTEHLPPSTQVLFIMKLR
jgi:hypothetical protein